MTQIFDAAEVYGYLPLVDGRTAVAWNEVLRLLATYLPDAIEYTNVRLGFDAPGSGNPMPGGYYVAGETLTEAELNCILVGVKVDTVPLGPRQFQDNATLTIYDVWERSTVREQCDEAWDRAGLIRAVLYPTLSGWCDPEGRRVWHKLRPLGKSGLPATWIDYSGVALTYELVQAPGSNNWV